MPPTTARRAAIALLLVAGLVFSARVGVGDKSVPSSSPPTARTAVARTDHAHGSRPAVPAATPGSLASEAAARRADALAQITAFTDWLTAWRRASPTEQPALVAAGRALATARRPALKYLIETDPREALARTVPVGLRAKLPADVQAQLETRIDDRGNLDVTIDCFGRHDGDDEPVSHLHRAATVDGQRYEAYVFGRRAQQPTKFGLPLHGIAIDETLALDEAPYRAIDDMEKSARGLPRETTAVLIGSELSQLDSPAAIKSLEAQLIAAESADGPYVRAASGTTGDGTDDRQRAGVTKPLSWTLGEKKILWFMVSFADDPAAPFTVAQIQAAADTMDAYYRAVSRGRESNVATILPVALPLPQSKAYYNRANLAGELATTAITLAKAYDAAGAYDPAKFDRYVIVFKPMSAYNFGGSAGIGGPQLLLNGTLSPDIICHEIGHTHTLPHADWWRAMDGTSLNGSFKEYGDIYDLMGSAGSDTELGFFNTAMQAKLGYIDDTNGLKTVTASGRYRLTRQDDGGATGTLALKLVSDAVPYPYFVEYRTSPYTRWLDAGQLDRLRHGVQLRWGPEIGPNYTHSTTTLVRIGSYLVDATPASNADVHDAAVRIGESYLDPDAGITIRPVATGGTAPSEYIDVDVFFGAIDGNRNPALTFNPPATVNPRDNVTFTASATDPDGDTVFFLWDFGDDTPLPYTDSVTRRFDTAGTYTVRVTAIDRKGGYATKSATINVVESPGGWVARNSGVTVLFNDVGFGAGRFVAVGATSTIVTSTDGATWTRAATPANLGTGAGLRGVASDGRRIVVVGQLNGVGIAIYSDDGLAWNVGTVPGSPAQFNDVAFGGGRFVAVGDNGVLFTSADGAAWTAAATSVTDALQTVAYAAGRFVVGGLAGRVLVSTEGLTWQNRSTPQAAPLAAVGYYGGAWLIGLTPASLFTSPDGATWTRVTATSATPTGQFTSPLRPIAGKLLAGVGRTVVYPSSASDWVAQTVTSNTNITITGVAEGNGTVVAVGSANGAIFSAPSASLQNSASLTPPALRLEAESLKLSAGKPNVIAVTGDGFVKLELYANRVKVAEISGPAGSFVWTPPRSGTYTLQVRGIDAAGNSAFSPIYEGRAGLMQWRWRNPSPVGVNLNDAVRVGNRWWLVGNVGTLLTLDDDGTVSPVAFPSTQHLNSIAYAGGRFVIGTPQTDGASRETLTPAWTSTDGYTWAETTGLNLTLNRVRFAAGAWVGAANEGNVLTSPDGSTWTSVSTGLITPLYGLVYGGNTWVAVGAGGKIVTSANASAWTERTSGVTASLRDVGFSGGIFTAVGDGGTILTSTDGTTWTRRTSGVTTNLNAIGMVNGALLAAGDSGVLLTSGDGVTWSPSSLDGKFSNSLFVGGSSDASLILGRAGEIYTRTAATAWRRLTTGTGDARYGVIYAGGRFVAVGEATDAITRTTVAPVSVSTDGLTWTRANANAAFGTLRAVTYGQNLYVAVGDSGKIFTSADALTWTARASGTTTNLLGVAASANGYAAVGVQGVILSSPDGSTWTARTSGTTATFNAVAFGNGHFVAAGNAARVSTDGVTWTTPTGLGNANTIAWLGTDGFIAPALGLNINLYMSPDGVTWTTFGMNVSDTWSAITKTPFGPAVAGANGTLEQSINDGGHWPFSVLPTDQRVLGLASSAATVVAVGEGGTLLTFALNDSTPAPVIAAAPTARDVNGSTVLSIAAQNTSGAVYQWFKDGQAIVGANNPEYIVPAADAGRLGAFTVRLTTPAGSVTSTPVGSGPIADPARLVNLSILTALTSADDTFTFGVVIGGAGTSGSKSLLVRAAGPSLAALGVPGTLDDPKLQFYTGTAKVGENDNWSGNSTTALVMAQVGAFPFSSATSRDAALWLPSLATGANSAVISGTGAGTVIAELYDTTPSTSFTATTPRLVNVSVLKQLGTGVTAGFVIGGTGTRTVLVRAIGPTLGLAPFGLPGVVADPQLTLNRGTAVIGSNDNWGGDAKLSAAFTQVGAFALPANSRDAALVATLEPGNYTVQVSGIGGTGVALIEVYEVP